MCTPAAPLILKEFSSTNQLYVTFLVSIWELGEAFGPLLMAPLSEVYGRVVIYNTANILFIAFSIAGAVSSNLNMLIAFRFLNGITVASVTLNPSIVGDMFIVEERGTAMSIMGLTPLLGPVAGPIIGGYLSQDIGWRWTFWLAAIMATATEIVFLAVFRETYKPKILERKAAKLREKTGVTSFHAAHSNAITRDSLLKISIVRPARMLILSPIVLLLAIYVATVFGYLYLLFTSLTEVFQQAYGFSTGEVSLTFLGIGVASMVRSKEISIELTMAPGIGMTAGMFLCKASLDRYVKKMKAAGGMKPEHRLPPMVLGGLAIPTGLFIYGWTARPHVHWIAPVIGTGIVGFGLMVTIIPTFSYLVDAFGIHAASAIACTITLRCLTGAVLPLAGPPLYGRLGVGWGNSVLGFIALVFVPVPLILMKYGESLRKSSKLEVIF